MTTFRSIAKNLCPPFLYDCMHKLKLTIVPERYGFFGNYNNYEEASQNTEGYEKNEIVDNVIRKTQQLIEEINKSIEISAHDQQLLAAFAMIEKTHAKGLTVVDFGGALGTHFFMLKKFFPADKINLWLVCETSAMALAGKKHFSNAKLQFFQSISEIPESDIDVILSSGSLQYVERPMDMFEKIAELKPKYIIFNRTPFAEIDKDRLTIQVVDPILHGGSLPAWFFSKSFWYKLFLEDYEIIANWLVPQDVWHLDNVPVICQGLILKRRMKKPYDRK